MTNHHQYMQRAIELAYDTAITNQHGGPFGCIIVRGGNIVAEGVNRVLVDKDPTCHGEVAAIRAACKVLDTHNLSGCTLYTSSEPCPMCYAASWWARIDAIYYAGTIQDAKEYGKFDDLPIYEALQIPGPDRALPALEVGREDMLEVWRKFRDMPNRLHY
jgi:tRNA(Arg) A34 adenosine deaminase TadA